MTPWGHLVYSLQSWYWAPNFQSPLYPKKLHLEEFPLHCSVLCGFSKGVELSPAFRSHADTAEDPGEPLHARTGHSGTQEDGSGTLKGPGCLSMCLHSLWRAAQSQHMTPAEGSPGWGILCIVVKVRGVLMDRNLPPSLALHLVFSICQLSNEAKQ